MSKSTGSRRKLLKLSCIRIADSAGLLGMTGVLGLMISILVYAHTVISIPVQAEMTPAKTIAGGPDQVDSDNGLAVSRPVTQNSPVQLPILSSSTQIPQVLRQIEQIAKRHDLDWNSADYRFTPAGSAGIATLEISRALKTTYVRARGFITDSLELVPGLALREFSAKRQDVESQEVEVQFTMVVFMDHPPATANASALTRD